MEQNTLEMSMQLLMEQLHFEWERSGEIYKRVTVDVKDLEVIHMIITDAVNENGQWLNKDKLSFKNCLKLSKENFVLLRLAKKLKNAEKGIKQHTKWICLDLDREERKVYRKFIEKTEV